MRDSFKYFVDPGDAHVGVAMFANRGDGWFCEDTWEMDPESAEDLFAVLVSTPSVETFCYERFKLFGHLAKSQIGSEFGTSQLIGVIKFLARTQGHAKLKLEVQDPNVQPVAEGWAKKKGVTLQSVLKGRGPHAKSAELHGWFYLGRRNYQLKEGVYEG